MDSYFIAHCVTEAENKRAILLSKVNAKSHACIKIICAPKQTKEVPYNEIIKLVTELIKSKINVTVLSSQFRRGMPSKNEAIGQYVATLKESALSTNVTSKDAKIAVNKIQKNVEELEQVIIGRRNIFGMRQH